ncbi:MAG: hypothetical protein GF311_17170, partial [Candidatus Lokiarchaeota archaeon]|nr:hypothetical protein [Candidatus Lokiarchaeota archaeon]
MSYTQSMIEASLSFTAYNESGEELNTTIYENRFKGGSPSLFQLDNNIKTVVNDQDDDDGSNDEIVEIPYLQQILEVNHPIDNVPLFYDYVKVYEKGKLVKEENLLTKTVKLEIPGLYSSNMEMGTDIDEYELEVIEVIPDEGVYYCGQFGFFPDRIEGKYYYFDGDGDGNFETVFVLEGTNEDANVISVGFDYDGNGQFNPQGLYVVDKKTTGSITYHGPLKSLMKMESDLMDEIGEWVCEAFNTYGWTFDMDIILSHDLIDPDGTTYCNEYEGLTIERVFSDSLFELWKLKFEGDSTHLIEETDQLTADRLMGDDFWMDFAKDCIWQTVVGLASLAAGAYGGQVGYFLVMFGLTIAHSLIQKNYMENYLRATTYIDPDYKGQVKLSEKYVMDKYFGNQFTQILTPAGEASGIYQEVNDYIAHERYSANVILCEEGIQKAFYNLFTTERNYVEMVLDYGLQTRGYVAYSDLNHNHIEEFLEWKYGGADVADISKFGDFEYGADFNMLAESSYTYSTGLPPIESEFLGEYSLEGNTGDIEIPTGFRALPEFKHISNNIMILEDAIYDATEDLEHPQQPQRRLLPYLVNGIPHMGFTSGAAAPNFFIGHPIYLSEDRYNEYGRFTYEVYKEFDGKSSYKIHSTVRENYAIEVPSITAFIYPEGYEFDYEGLNLSPDESTSSNFGVSILQEGEDYTYNPTQGTITLTTDQTDRFNEDLNEDDKFIILEIYISKYRELKAYDNYTKGDVNRIAAMQNIHASILEYFYQYNLAVDMAEKIHEAIYTMWVTAVSTIATLGIGAKSGLSNKFTEKIGGEATKATFSSVVGSAAQEVVQELLLDPLIENTVSAIIGEMGGSEDLQMVGSTFATIARETLLSPVAGKVLGIKKSGGAQSNIDQNTEMNQNTENAQETNKEVKSLTERATTAAKNYAKAFLTIAGMCVFSAIGPLGIMSTPFSVGLGMSIVFSSTSDSVLAEWAKNKIADKISGVKSQSAEVTVADEKQTKKTGFWKKVAIASGIGIGAAAALIALGTFQVPLISSMLATTTDLIASTGATLTQNAGIFGSDSIMSASHGVMIGSSILFIGGISKKVNSPAE